MTNITAVAATAPDKRSTDELIAEAEAAVALSDGRIDQRTVDLKRALVAQGGKLAVGAVIAAAVTGLLIWRPWQNKYEKARTRRRKRFIEREGREHSRDRSRTRSFFSTGDSNWSIFSLIGLIWPLLPFRIPSPLGPKMTAFLLGMGLPVTPKPEGEESVPPPMVEAEFDPTRYFGQWYELARLPLKFESSCAGDVTATYAPLTDGSGQLRVVNSCRSVDGGFEVAEGVGKLAHSGSPAKLKVSFAPAFMRALPFVWADYWVLQVDPEYSIALVGTPDRKNLWFLSREPKLDETTFAEMQDHAIAQGYDLTDLIRTVQTVPASTSARQEVHDETEAFIR